MKSCFFIGHREIPEGLAPFLREAIERHIIEHGVREFVVGGYGAFDRLVAQRLAEAKLKHPEISLMLLTPYHPSERKINLPEAFDFVFYPPGLEKVPKRFAIVRANMYMVEHCDCLIAYVWHTASNAKAVLEHAEGLKKKGQISIENLAEKIRP